jgi:hypothetical protein
MALTHYVHASKQEYFRAERANADTPLSMPRLRKAGAERAQSDLIGLFCDAFSGVLHGRAHRFSPAFH